MVGVALSSRGCMDVFFLSVTICMGCVPAFRAASSLPQKKQMLEMGGTRRMLQPSEEEERQIKDPQSFSPPSAWKLLSSLA